jgi:hypothetical protein
VKVQHFTGKSPRSIGAGAVLGNLGFGLFRALLVHLIVAVAPDGIQPQPFGL